MKRCFHALLAALVMICGQKGLANSDRELWLTKIKEMYSESQPETNDLIDVFANQPVPDGLVVIHGWSNNTDPEENSRVGHLSIAVKNFAVSIWPGERTETSSCHEIYDDILDLGRNEHHFIIIEPESEKYQDILYKVKNTVDKYNEAGETRPFKIGEWTVGCKKQKGQVFCRYESRENKFITDPDSIKKWVKSECFKEGLKSTLVTTGIAGGTGGGLGLFGGIGLGYIIVNSTLGGLISVVFPPLLPAIAVGCGIAGLGAGSATGLVGGSVFNLLRSHELREKMDLTLNFCPGSAMETNNLPVISCVQGVCDVFESCPEIHSFLVESCQSKSILNFSLDVKLDTSTLRKQNLSILDLIDAVTVECNDQDSLNRLNALLYCQATESDPSTWCNSLKSRVRESISCDDPELNIDPVESEDFNEAKLIRIFSNPNSIPMGLLKQLYHSLRNDHFSDFRLIYSDLDQQVTLPQIFRLKDKKSGKYLKIKKGKHPVLELSDSESDLFSLLEPEHGTLVLFERNSFLIVDASGVKKIGSGIKGLSIHKGSENKNTIIIDQNFMDKPIEGRRMTEKLEFVVVAG